MAKIVLISLLLLAFFTAKAQDKIVTTQNEPNLNKIALINSKRILYELEVSESTTNQQLSQGAELMEYYCSNQSLQTAKSKEQEALTIPNYRWCFSLNIGLSNMPWILENYLFESDYPNIYKNLNKGMHANIIAYYMANNILGIGAEYSFLLSDVTNHSYRKNTNINSYSTYINVEEKFHQYINYVGPSFLFQQYLGKQKKISIRETLSFGAVFYRLENQTNYPKYLDYTYRDITYNSLMTGNTTGVKIGIAIEYIFSKHMSIGLSSDFLKCELETADFESNGYDTYNYSDKNVDLDYTLNLSRVDYSIILHYRF